MVLPRQFKYHARFAGDLGPACCLNQSTRLRVKVIAPRVLPMFRPSLFACRAFVCSTIASLGVTQDFHLVKANWKIPTLVGHEAAMLTHLPNDHCFPQLCGDVVYNGDTTEVSSRLVHRKDGPQSGEQLVLEMMAFRSRRDRQMTRRDGLDTVLSGICSALHQMALKDIHYRDLNFGNVLIAETTSSLARRRFWERTTWLPAQRAFGQYANVLSKRWPWMMCVPPTRCGLHPASLQ